MPLFLPPIPPHPGVRNSPAAYYSPASIQISATTGAMTAGRVFYAPFLLPGATVDRIGVDVTTGAAGNLRLGIYTNNNGLPGQLLMGSSALDTTNIAFVEHSFTAIQLPQDWVWAAALFEATPTVTVGTAINGNIVGGPTPTTLARCIQAPLAYQALPATAAVPTTTSTGPLILIRKS